MYWVILSHRVLGYSVTQGTWLCCHTGYWAMLSHARYWARLCCTSSHNVLGYTVTQGTGLFCRTQGTGPGCRTQGTGPGCVALAPTMYWVILSHRVLGYSVTQGTGLFCHTGYWAMLSHARYWARLCCTQGTGPGCVALAPTIIQLDTACFNFPVDATCVCAVNKECDAKRTSDVQV